MNLTLTGVSNAIKKYGPYVVLGILSFFILYYSIKIGIIIYKAQKEPEVIYNPIFGVIKKPTIKNSSNSAGLKFSIDTIEGKPVTTTASANIYFIPIPETKFGYRNRLFFMAQNFGIIDPISKYKLIDKNAEFTDEFQKLEIDIRNLNFSYEYFYQNEPELFDDTVIPTNEEAEKEAIEFLNDIMDRGMDVQEFAKAIISYLRQAFIVKVAADDAISIDNPLVAGLTKEELEKMTKQAKSFDEKELSRCLNLFLEAENKMRFSPIQQLPLELAIIEHCVPGEK